MGLVFGDCGWLDFVWGWVCDRRFLDNWFEFPGYLRLLGVVGYRLLGSSSSVSGLVVGFWFWGCWIFCLGFVFGFS